MKLITLYLPEHYIKALDELVNERFYPNRSEAIRVAIRDLLTTSNTFRRHTHVSEQSLIDIQKPPEELCNQRRHLR